MSLTKKMSTKRKKPHSGNMDIALAYRFDMLPGPVLKSEVFSRLVGFIRDGVELPDNWRATLRWRNSPKQDWREDEFQNSITESREGFRKLVLGRLLRDAAGITLRPPEPPEQRREIELAEIEDLLGEDFETLAEARRALARATVRKRVARKRREAIHRTRGVKRGGKHTARLHTNKTRRTSRRKNRVRAKSHQRRPRK
jgi:hypothetical protein